MISVILTTYDRRVQLAETLASVFAQTFTDYEVIVVDDGSTDGTTESLAGAPVLLVPVPHSGNPALVRNEGLARARGELIAFLDSDDAWCPTALAELSKALDEHPEAGFSYCNYQAAPSPMPQLPAVGNIFDALLETDFLVTGGVLIRRSVAAAVGGFDSACSPAEDWDYWLRLAALSPGAYVPNSLIRIGSSPDSLSRVPGGLIYRANVRVLRKAFTWCIGKRPTAVKLARQSLRRKLLASARYHWRHRAFARSMHDLVSVPIGR